MSIVDTTRAISAAKMRLCQTIFNIDFTDESSPRNQWPGVHAYLNFVEQQFEASGYDCFRPLWQTFHFPLPVTVEDMFGFLTSVALCLNESITQEELTIDGILQSLLTPFSQQLRNLDAQYQELSRQAVFKAVLWLTMLFNASTASVTGRFLVQIPLKGVGLHKAQGVDMARRPIGRLLRGFGSLLPTSEDSSAAIEDLHPRLIYASSLNICSLKLIDKIQIKWTSSLGCHLLFNPLKRTLMVFRFPTFCALHCLNGSQNTCNNSNSVSASELDAFKREVILSYRLIFGQNSKSRREFRKVERRQVTSHGNQYDALLDIICGQPVGHRLHSLPREIWPDSSLDEHGRLLVQDVYSTSLDFPLLGSRLLKVQGFDLRQQPSRVRDLWRDRRNPLQWYAFWAVLVVGGFTIIISGLQLVVSCISLAYQIK